VPRTSREPRSRPAMMSGSDIEDLRIDQPS
jgi:hypothetical protein